jgi:hypothetical protein
MHALSMMLGANVFLSMPCANFLPVCLIFTGFYHLRVDIFLFMQTVWGEWIYVENTRRFA